MITRSDPKGVVQESAYSIATKWATVDKKARCYYRTPAVVIEKLSEHYPVDSRRVLDPCVGDGALLEPFFVEGHSCSARKIIALDKYSHGIGLGHFPSEVLSFISTCFIEWAVEHLQLANIKAFDLVVLNPPFRGKKSEWVKLDSYVKIDMRRRVYLPIEAVFLLLSVSLVRAKGKVCCVVPDSMVRGKLLERFRSFLERYAEVVFQERLRNGVFAGTDGCSWIVVYRVRKQVLGNCAFDEIINELSHYKIRFQDSLRSDQIKESSIKETCRLSDIASVIRGKAQSPAGKKYAIHSTDYVRGGWQLARPIEALKVVGDTMPSVRLGDYLLARVGRNCIFKFGKGDEVIGFPITDCLFIIRPKSPLDLPDSSFREALHAALVQRKDSLLKGVGANYITMEDLNNLVLKVAV